MKFSTIIAGLFTLFTGMSFSLRAIEQSVIEQRAQLMKLVDLRDSEQFKQHISQIRLRVGQKDIVAPVVDYIKTLQGQKTAQLAQNMGKSRKIAAAKAAFCGLLSASAVTAYLAFLRTWLNAASKKIFVQPVTVADLHDKDATVPKVMGPLELFGSFHYLCIPSLVYLSVTWTRENAQFAWYGNNLLLQDIRTLDDMLAYVNSVA